MENNEKGTRQVKTLHFGMISVEEDYIFHFENGLLGFDGLREFVLISDEETMPFRWLVSIDEPTISFPLLSPWLIDLSYKPGKQFDDPNFVLFSIVTLEDDMGNMTANLKAPIVLNISNQTGEQVILTNDKYSPMAIIPKG